VKNVVKNRSNLLVLQDGGRHDTGVPTRIDRDFAIQPLANNADGSIDVGQEVVGTSQWRKDSRDPLPPHLVTGKAVLEVEITSTGTLGF
jgi:hypothetical protein